MVKLHQRGLKSQCPSGFRECSRLVCIALISSLLGERKHADYDQALKMILISSAKVDVPPSAVTRPICGILGTIRLVAGRQPAEAASRSVQLPTDCFYHTGMYLIVITRKKNVGSLLGHAVWKAVDFDVISYKKTVLHLSEIQVSAETCCFQGGKQGFYRLLILEPPIILEPVYQTTSQ